MRKKKKEDEIRLATAYYIKIVLDIMELQAKAFNTKCNLIRKLAGVKDV